MASPKNLGEVYVPARLKFRPPRTNANRPGPGEREATQPEEVLPVAEMLSHAGTSHALIVGGPGAGKSTLLRQLAEHAWQAPDIIGLKTPHIPMLVSLRMLASTHGSIEKRLGEALSQDLTLKSNLHEGFLSDWPKQTQARWLILLDGLDEAPEGTRREVIEWLSSLSRLTDSRIVISSRPSEDFIGQLEPGRFKHYEVQPFSRDQAVVFAQNWLGEQADQFLEAYAHLEAGTLKDTPLLLTIAAKIYSQQGDIPRERSALYQELVRVVLTAALVKELNVALQEKLTGDMNLHLVRLGYLALRVIEADSPSDATSLAEFMADYLQTREGFLPLHAKVFGRRYIDIMGRRSGLLVGRGTAYEFLHMTVRDYLAARHLIENHDVTTNVMKHWNDSRYEDVLAFILSIAATAGKQRDVTAALSQLVRYGEDTYGANPQALYALGRSPLRTALRLITRAAVGLEDQAELRDLLFSRIAASEPRQGAVAGDTQAPPAILGRLAQTASDEWIQSEVAGNPSTPPDILQHLAEHGNDDFQVPLAGNPSTPPDILQHLAKHGNDNVQVELATNPSTPLDVLEYLVKTGNTTIQGLVMCSSKVLLEGL